MNNEILQLTNLTKAKLLEFIALKADQMVDLEGEGVEEMLEENLDSIQNAIYVLRNCEYDDREHN